MALTLLQQIVVPQNHETQQRLRELVAEVANNNRNVPSTLASYSGRVEAEASLIFRDDNGRERVLSVQQLSLRVQWARDGTYTEHVIGARSVARSLLRYDALHVPSITIPVLYGNRMSLLFGPTAASEELMQANRTSSAVEAHPLAEDRDRIYAYRGGEVTERWDVGDRTISVARVHVTALHAPEHPTTVFEGELFIDVERRQLMGMRGRVRELGGRAGAMARVRTSLARELGYLEVLTAEIDGRYWLPSTERIELGLSSALATSESVILRISSRFRDITPSDRVPDNVSGAAQDSLVPRTRRLTVATRDSLDGFMQWGRPIGEATAADEFAHIAGVGTDRPASGRAMRARIGTRSFRESLRFNRVEGPFTGTGIIVPLTPRSIDASFIASGGRAWSEGTWRGSAAFELAGAVWRGGVDVGRTLESTNDFVHPPNEPSLLGAAVFTRDDHDYVDRYRTGAFLRRQVPGSALRLSVEVARITDHDAARTVRSGLIRTDSVFRVNRPVTAGTYSRGRLTLDLNPNVIADYLHPGVGVRLGADLGGGDAPYQRLEAHLAMQRVSRGGWALGARADVGSLWVRDSVPLQQLFELGGPTQLPGFEYKVLSGNRAALGSVSVAVPLATLAGSTRAARRLRTQLSVTLFAGIVESSSPSVSAASLRLSGPSCAGAPDCPKEGQVHASAQVGVRLLDGALFVGVRRRVSMADRWALAFAAHMLPSRP